MADVDPFFGDAVIEDADVDENGKVQLPRFDLDRYRVFLSRVPVGKQARLTVPTGDIIPDVKTDRLGDPVIDEETGKPVLNVNRGRGKDELEAVRSFRTVANNELNLGIDIRYQHMPDGTTVLRLALHPKRTFTEEQNAKREAARQIGLIRRAEKRVATTATALARFPNDPKRKEAAARAKETLAKLRASQNGDTPTTQPVPAKTPAAKAPAAAKS